jgi:E3 ubiquitin-protein ligase RAD18
MSAKEDLPASVKVALARAGKIIEGFQCEICHGVLRVPVITKRCGHTYCSSCIRRYLKKEAKCPRCGEKCKKEDLVPNRTLDFVTVQFWELKRSLVDVVRAAADADAAATADRENQALVDEQVQRRQSIHDKLIREFLDTPQQLAELRIECPTCQVPFAESLIQEHANACADQAASPPPPSSSSSSSSSSSF